MMPRHLDHIDTKANVNPPRVKTLARVIALALLFSSFIGCNWSTQQGERDSSEEGPGGRKQELALSPIQELGIGRRSQQEVLSEFRDRVLPIESPETRRVHAVSERLAKAAEIEPLQREILLHVRGYHFEWEEHVIKDKQINAFCLPAGKIVVFTGILPVTADDHQLATVLGHEMAHALAHHGSERVAR